MNKLVRFIFIAGMSIAILVQVVRPTMENPPSDPALSIRIQETIPPEILSMLERSCFDCHSNETRWPWYPGASLSKDEIKAISEWVYDEQTRLSELADYGQKNNR